MCLKRGMDVIMTKNDFKRLIQNKMITLDGATGTLLQHQGLPTGSCPEEWVLKNSHILLEIQKSYVEAGADIVYSFTFGANKIKLEEFGLADMVEQYNIELVGLSKKAVGSTALVAGVIAPTGQFIQPTGELLFEEAVEIFKQQAKALEKGGADLFVIETMLDIQEARAALIAIKEVSQLPVMITMTFDEKQRTLTGTDPVSALNILQSLGADAVGCNCSTGPKEMVKAIAMMKPYARVPIIAKPNAGMPKLTNGRTEFDMSVDDFVAYYNPLVEAGATMIGGCCGTTPDYIKRIHEMSKAFNVHLDFNKQFTAVSSSKKTVFIGKERPLTIIGERINPTGKKALQEELRNNSLNIAAKLARDQIKAGADILDVNVGMPGVNEKELMLRMVDMLQMRTDIPLCIDSSSVEVIEAALRVYPGRALINSISAEKHKLERLLPIAAKYGAVFVLLPLDDNGVPFTAEERIGVIEYIYQYAQRYGYMKSDIIVDGLVMTVSAEQKAAIETLKVVNACSNDLGFNTILGLSNVSFGLPERKWVNSAFFAMAVANGLTSAICNPSDELLMSMKMASDILMNRDKTSKAYISYCERYNQQQREKLHDNTPMSDNIKSNNAEADKAVKNSSVIYKAVLEGQQEEIEEHIKLALQQKAEPQEIVNNHLIPAISKVGEYFESKRYFLPQLIQSAETMKKGFTYLEPLLKSDSDSSKKCKNRIRIVIATVKGDIHDIGKNIVALMLRNYGFEVTDLGKDVSAEKIINTAIEQSADVIALSALMTTTMVEMKNVIELGKKKGLVCKFMIGGAVVNQQYADEIGADAYSKDAYEAVKTVQRLFNL